MAFDILTQHGGTALKDFLSSLLAPLQTNTDNMKSFETEYNKRSKFNGQKIVLQEALNNIFSVTVAPFIIVETNNVPGINLYVFEPAENSPIIVKEITEGDPLYIFESGEITSDYNFLVKIPVGIYTAELDRRIKAETNRYKIVGVTFTTVTY
jgi:hypothetical protein